MNTGMTDETMTGILRIVMAVFGCRCCGHTRWFHRSWTVSTMLACHGDCRCVDYVTSLWDRGVAMTWGSPNDTPADLPF